MLQRTELVKIHEQFPKRGWREEKESQSFLLENLLPVWETVVINFSSGFRLNYSPLQCIA